MNPALRFYKNIRSRFSIEYVREDLFEMLSQASPEGSLEEQIEWLDSLVDWIRLPVAVGDKKEKRGIQNVRISYLLQVLSRNPDIETKVSSTLQSILLKTNVQSLFCRTGMTQDQGFFYEMAERLEAKVLPRYMNPRELADIFALVFQQDEDADWIDNLDTKSMEGILKLFSSNEEAKEKFGNKVNMALASSLLILSARALALSVSETFQERMGVKEIKGSPFFLLNFELMEYREQIETGQLTDEQRELIWQQISLCEKFIEYVHEVLEFTGVSLTIVFKLENLSNLLKRIRILLTLQNTGENSERNNLSLLNFLSDLITEEVESRSIGKLFATNFDLLAMKTVERTGQSGESYITRNKTEYYNMLTSAGGGGAIAALTSLLKAYIIKLNFPIVFEHLFNWVNYSASFVSMQLLHFTLATKTPSMTAASLANRLKELKVSRKYDEFLEEVSALSRSGFAAALGNLGIIIPTAITMDFIFYLIFDFHLLDQEYGEKQLKVNNPFASFTIFYAALTAFALWISSVAGGWLENWFAFNRLYKRISASKNLRKRFSPEKAEKIANWVQLHISGFGTNISLGFLLAFLGIGKELLGLPIDVRHVTLTTGKITLGLCGMDLTADHIWPIALTVIGVIFIGLINFGVSFALSLFVAARAQHMRFGEFPGLIGAVWFHFKKNPKRYFIP